MSEHFSDSEFACHCCGALPENGMSPALIDGLERLRADIGGLAIHLTCGYRCPSHNAEVGGVPNSQHVQGCASDIYVDEMSVGELAWYAKKIFDGVGEYYNQGFVHVDMRDEGENPGYYLWNDQ